MLFARTTTATGTADGKRRGRRRRRAGPSLTKREQGRAGRLNAFSDDFARRQRCTEGELSNVVPEKRERDDGGCTSSVLCGSAYRILPGRVQTFLYATHLSFVPSFLSAPRRQQPTTKQARRATKDRRAGGSIFDYRSDEEEAAGGGCGYGYVPGCHARVGGRRATDGGSRV